MAVCSVCGAQLRPGAPVCAACGTRVLPAPGPQLPAPVPPAPPAALPSGACLVAPQGQFSPVFDGLTVGRDPGCTFVLDDAEVSRRHAAIVAHGAGWAVQDLGSRNGTFVNGARVAALTPLYHKDQLRFGGSALLALYDPQNPPPPNRALPTAGLSAPPAGPPGQLGQPGQPAPQLIAWARPPQVEGRILQMHEPRQIERGGKVGKALMSVALGAVNPALVFLPWMVGSSHILVTTLRVEQVGSGRKVAVTLLGDVRSELSDGDLIAVWGRDEHGTLLGRVVYNYELGTMQEFK